MHLIRTSATFRSAVGLVIGALAFACFSATSGVPLSAQGTPPNAIWEPVAAEPAADTTRLTGLMGSDLIPDIVLSPESGAIPTQIRSGANGVVLGAGFPFGPGFAGGVRTAAGDLTGDGIADVVTAMGPGGGLVRLVNGQTAAIIGGGHPFGAAFSGGLFVAVADFNSDGRNDIVVSQGQGGATVRVFSGVDYSLLWNVQPFGPGYTGGVTVAAADVTGDGQPDLVVGQVTGGLVAVLDGASRTVLASGPPFGGGFRSGVFVAAADVTGSGTASLILAPARGSAPVLVFDVQTLSVLASLHPYGPGFTAGIRVAATDLTGDGRAEILTTPGPGGGSLLAIFHGGTFAPFASLPVFGGFSGGVFVSTPPASGLDVAFTSAGGTTFVVGQAGTFSVETEGEPPVSSITVSGGLPPGVTFVDHGNGTGTLSGTPVAPGGNHTLTFTASNGRTSATQTFQLTINQAPAVTSPNTAAFQVGLQGNFTVTTNGHPHPTIQVAGALPTGVSATDNGNGTATLSGIPAASTEGNYALTVTATNGVSSPATQALTLTVNPCPALPLSPAAGALPSGAYQSPYTLTFTAPGASNATFQVLSGTLPAGLSLAGNGTLSGTPATTGTFAFTVRVSTAAGCAGTAAYMLNITPVAENETLTGGVGNTQFSVGAGTPSTPAVVVSGSVLTNDRGPGPLSAGPASIASAQGGQVAMAANGTFLYTPPTGFAGPSDSFTYVLTDANGLTDTAVVTLGLSGVVWYVNAAAPPGGDGRSPTPINTMTAAAAAAQTGHVIYVFAGSPSGATVLKSGQTLWGAGAPFTLNNLHIPATAAPMLSGPISLASNSVVRALSVDGVGAPAMLGNGLAGATVVDAVNVVGGSEGLNLTNVAGTFQMTGGSIAGITAGPAVQVSGGTAAVNIGAGITATVGHSVVVQNRTAGSVTFSGPIADTGDGILLNANTGSSITFTGGLAVSTASGDAFTATGGGTIVATQNNDTIVNTLSSPEGTALRVVETTIGGAGLTFRSISAGDASTTSGAGVVLDRTGTAASDGGLTVTGNGTPSSGGVIRRKSGPDGALTDGVGISLRTTKAPSFRWMELTQFSNSAIAAVDVHGFTLTNSSIDGVGDTAGIGEGPVVFGRPVPDPLNGLVGTGIIRDTVITGGIEHNVALYTYEGTSSLTIDGTTDTPSCQVAFNSGISGGDGLHVVAANAANVTLNVNHCLIRGNRAAALRAIALDTASLELYTAASDFAASGQGYSGLVLSNGNDARLVATVYGGSSFNNLPGPSIHLGQTTTATAASDLRLSVSETTISSGDQPVTSSVLAEFGGAPGAATSARLLIEANNAFIHHGPQPVITIRTPDAAAAPVVDVTIADNHIDVEQYGVSSDPDPVPLFAPVGIQVEATAAGASLCANMHYNTSHARPTFYEGGNIRLEQSGTATVLLERGSAAPDADAAAVLNANTGMGPFGASVTEVAGAITVVDSGTCRVP